LHLATLSIYSFRFDYPSLNLKILDATVTYDLLATPELSYRAIQIIGQGSFRTLISPWPRAAHSFQVLSTWAAVIEIDNNRVVVVMQHDISRFDVIMSQTK